MLVWLRELEAGSEINFLALLNLVLSDHLLHLLPINDLLFLLFCHSGLGISLLKVFENELFLLPEESIIEWCSKFIISRVRLFAYVRNCWTRVNTLAL